MNDLSNHKTIMVTGTGTGVGKTLACGALALALRQLGHGVRYFKPVESGVTDDAGSDAGKMAELLGGWEMVSRPVTLRLPLAPLAAAILESHENISADSLAGHYAAFRTKSQNDIILVEGAGGLLAQIGFDAEEPDGILTYAGLAAHMSWPAIIVADAALGTLNHTMLTLEEARRRGIRILGIVINNFPDRAWLESNESENLNRLATSPLSHQELREALMRVPADKRGEAAYTNPAMMNALTQERILGVIPRFDVCDFSAQARMALLFLRLK